MKKNIIFVIISLFILISCWKKEDTLKSNISTWSYMNTWEIIDTNSWKEEEIMTWKIDSSISEEWDKTEILEKSWIVTYNNFTKNYKVSFKKSEDLLVEEKNNWELFIFNNNTKNILTIVSQKYLDILNVKSFDDYVNLGLEDIKNLIEVKNPKKEKYSLNWLNGYKIEYNIDKNNFTQYIFENNWYAIILIKVISDNKTENEIETIINSFDIIKK